MPASDGSPSWQQNAAQLLDRIVEHDDEHGDLANAQPDELRDALRIAAERLRVHSGREPRSAWLIGSRILVAEVWWLVQEQRLDARCRAADAALELRDMIDTRWWPDPDVERARVGR